MPNPSRLIELDPAHSWYVLPALFALAGAVRRAATRPGSRVWERLFSWASCPVSCFVRAALAPGRPAPGPAGEALLAHPGAAGNGVAGR